MRGKREEWQDLLVFYFKRFFKKPPKSEVRADGNNSGNAGAMIAAPQEIL
jgi:hypothetical protein